MARIGSLRLLLASAALATAAASAACPPVAVTLKTNAKASGTSAGKTIAVQARIDNRGTATLSNLGVGLYFSNGVCTIRSALTPKPKPRVAPLVLGNNMYWQTLPSVPPKKGLHIKLRGQVAASLTAGAELTVGAVAYIVGTNCSATAILSTFEVNPRPATAKKAVSQAKGASCGLNPVVDPTAAYSPYAFQQRCAEAQLVNFDNRRLAGPRSLYVDPVGTIRSLESLPTPDMCYQECSDLLGPDTPFFANLYESGDGGNLCYCCEQCTLVPATNVTVYQVNVAAPKLCGFDTTCASPQMDQQPGSYTDEYLCAAQCRAANPNYVWMTFNNCYDECYCGLACTSTTNEDFSDLFALDWQACPL